MSKAGNPRLRTTLIQLAWLWLRNQPHSALTLWFHERVSRNGGRLRKTTVVALARKLLVALWKYVTAGVVIEGATMKAPHMGRDRSMVCLLVICRASSESRFEPICQLQRRAAEPHIRSPLEAAGTKIHHTLCRPRSSGGWDR